VAVIKTNKQTKQNKIKKTNTIKLVDTVLGQFLDKEYTTE